MDADLYEAASRGDIDGVLRMRDKIEQVTEGKGETILHLATLSNKPECVAAVLVKFPSLLYKVTSRNETALHLAAKNGYTSVAKILIDKADRLNSETSGNEISPEWINFIRKGNGDMDTALHLAVRHSNAELVELIVQADPSDEHSINSNSETPLYLAAVMGNDYPMRKILRNCRKAGVGGPDNKTALHATIIGGHHHCVGFLISRPDIFDNVDNKGWTAFHYAASLNNELGLDALIHLFQQTKGTLDAVMGRIEAVMGRSSSPPERKTAHHIAAFQGNVFVLKTLIQYCPDALKEVDGDGRNILHLAAMQNHKDLVQYILENEDLLLTHRFLITKDKDGNTPLHLLVIAGCYVPQLIKFKLPYASIRNNDRFTPQDLLYKDENIIGDQLMIKMAFEELTVNRRRFLWFRETESPESQRTAVHPSVRRKKDAKFKIEKTAIINEEVRLYRERTNTQIIVTALIATVTFTVGFTMPGGNHDGDTGDADNGLAILSKKMAFNVCIVADAIGLLFSASALFLYFMSSMYQDPHEVSKYNAASTSFNIVSVVAMMLTFITGTYVVLSHSPAIAITVCVISCVFFLLVIALLIKWKGDPIEKFKV